MYGIADNSWSPCPDCRTPLVELDGYDRVVGNDSAVYDGDDYANGPFFFFSYSRLFLMWLMSAIAGLFGGAHITLKEQKVKRLCRTVLPQYPNSLICPRCLFVTKRR
jgi:hypothetical protein